MIQEPTTSTTVGRSRAFRQQDAARLSSSRRDQRVLDVHYDFPVFLVELVKLGRKQV